MLATPGDGSAPRDAGDWTALHYRSLEQPSSPRVQLRFLNDFPAEPIFSEMYFLADHLLRHRPAPSALTKDCHLKAKRGQIFFFFTINIVTTTNITIMVAVLTWSGSPPKYSMLSFTQVSARAWSLKPWFNHFCASGRVLYNSQSTSFVQPRPTWFPEACSMSSDKNPMKPSLELFLKQ